MEASLYIYGSVIAFGAPGRMRIWNPTSSYPFGHLRLQLPSLPKISSERRATGERKRPERKRPSSSMENQASQSYPPAPFHHLLQQQQQQLQMFWSYQRQEIEQVSDFKNHQLPLARIKKIMKADEDVRMISAEAPILFAKACELFILELTIRSWLHAEENKRRTLQKNDIAAAITRTDIFDFLVDIVPRDEIKDEAPGAAAAAGGLMPGGAPGVPYYYPPPATAVGGGVMIGRPAIDPMAAAAYMQRPPQPGWQPLWAAPGLGDDGGYGPPQPQQGLDGQTAYGVPPPPPAGL